MFIEINPDSGQCQAIHARSLYPCQDTPAVKFTYNANVQVEKPLVVLMSAVRKAEPSDCNNAYVEYKFVQNVPIPSYLLAIVAGDLVSR